MVREFTVSWIGPGSGTATSVFHFNSESALTPQAQADGLTAWLQALAPHRVNASSARVNPDYRDLDTTTGAVVGAGTVVGDLVPSTAVGQALPDVAQVLVRWSTDTYAGGRRIQGRTFIPHVGVNAVENGNLLPATRAAIDAAGLDFIEREDLFVIWSRKNGQAAIVNGTYCWGEFATQRKRRG